MTYVNVRVCWLSDRKKGARVNAEPVPSLLSVGDLMDRWSFSRQGVNQLITREGPDFPAAVGAVNRGRIRLWLMSDIERYERERGCPKGLQR